MAYIDKEKQRQAQRESVRRRYHAPGSNLKERLVKAVRECRWGKGVKPRNFRAKRIAENKNINADLRVVEMKASANPTVKKESPKIKTAAACNKGYAGKLVIQRG